MKYYTIQNNTLLTAENEKALDRFYANVLKLPDDYEECKYIIDDNKLILNPNYETEKQILEKEKKIAELEKKMDIIDQKRIRAVCENEKKDDKITWLEYYNSLIIDLRQELSKLLS